MNADDATYAVEDVRAGREITPLVDYLDQYDHVEINCPACAFAHPIADLVRAGGVACEGCGRPLRLHVTVDAKTPGWRNVPADEREVWR